MPQRKPANRFAGFLLTTTFLVNRLDDDLPNAQETTLTANDTESPYFQ